MLLALPPVLPRTLRAIGIAVVAGGRAVDLALIETDGANHVRHSESERQPLAPGALLATVTQATRIFMGDRALQPFAVDLIGLVAEIDDLTADALTHASGVTTHVAFHGMGLRTGTKAEQAAYAVVVAQVRRESGTQSDPPPGPYGFPRGG
jgi:hypothetical protein